MIKFRTAAAVAGIAGLALIAGATPAHADTTQANCSVALGIYSSAASAQFTVQGATQRWASATYSFAGPQVGNKSNVNFRLRQSPDGTHSTSHKTYFFNDSPDALRPNTSYTVPINTNVPLSESIYVKFDTIFDLPHGIPDINCEAYTPFV
ncbi:hypothetical protein [Paractinoplanes brasiliensis]|jgi:hypothetical protein|uniref:Uncharacterized protein n=1 Tax=Paractinoplanes brasiliensis TaxID=52695 RepID=A0A4R6JRS8_9ACTN|nr:hypothetical protein [Actinoplanes brasiliensis]TDO39294.1 hypothetical protein C8E87_2971 [Actinoplanes brasiliensis]GID30003.1 hypothetical protein Abr02nite_49860 [Actinoplanes brasiliensis]